MILCHAVFNMFEPIKSFETNFKETLYKSDGSTTTTQKTAVKCRKAFTFPPIFAEGPESSGFRCK